MKKFKLLVSLTLVLTIIMSVIVVAPINVGAVANTWNPSAGVYDISTEEDLFAFNESLRTEEMYYDGIEINLLADITISEGRDWVSPPSQASPYAEFHGTFNGNDHTISNLNMVSSDSKTVSFLPLLYNATIKDLTLNNVTIEKGYSWNAAFACISYGNDTISNCHLDGNCLIKTDVNFSKNWNYSAGIIADNYAGNLEIIDCSVGENVRITPNSPYVSNEVAGGMVGYIRDNTPNLEVDIINCTNSAQICSNHVTGGIVGEIMTSKGNKNYLLINDCINYGDISSRATSSSEQCCAGIVGYTWYNSVVYIDGCANHGDVTVYGTSSNPSGGIVGYTNMCSIKNTYNTGNVTAEQANCLGGLIGQIRTNTSTPHIWGTEVIYYPEQFNSVINCYNTGNVIGENSNYVGGICGLIQDATTDAGNSFIENVYNFGTVTGNRKIGSAVASIDNTCSNVFALQGTTAIMDQSASSEVSKEFISNIGYFDTPDRNGKIYPATISAGQSEIISSTPLSTDLLQTLNNYVDEKNAELEADGNNYRYKSWKMTNPASEDGSKGVTVHPMFGVEV